MADKSITLQAIDFVSKGACTDLLVPRGFRRKAPHFFRQAGGLNHCIHFQASQWGSSDSGKFTINVYVTSPELYSAFCGQPFPKNPATASWPISQRIGFLLPKHCDHWWNISRASNLDIVGREVAESIEKYVIPFFERYPDANSLLTRALSESSDTEFEIIPSHRPLVAAILLSGRGDKVQALQILKTRFDKKVGHPFQETIRLIAKRVGLEL